MDRNNKTTRNQAIIPKKHQLAKSLKIKDLSSDNNYLATRQVVDTLIKNCRGDRKFAPTIYDSLIQHNFLIINPVFRTHFQHIQTSGKAAYINAIQVVANA